MIRMIRAIHSYDEQGNKGLRTLVEKQTGTRMFMQVHGIWRYLSNFRMLYNVFWENVKWAGKKLYPISLYWSVNRNPYNGLL